MFNNPRRRHRANGAAATTSGPTTVIGPDQFFALGRMLEAAEQVQLDRSEIKFLASIGELLSRYEAATKLSANQISRIGVLHAKIYGPNAEQKKTPRPEPGGSDQHQSERDRTMGWPEMPANY